MALSKWLQVSDLYKEGIFKFVPCLDKCITLLGEYVGK
jgi:hypothetical protein